MPNAQFNPLATLATSARQLNEQANQAVKSLGDSFIQTTNQLLATAAQGLPPLPPLPGAQATNPVNSRGNPNGGNQFPQLPTPQQLIPAQALQAVSQVEDVLLPPGIPRPSQALLQATRPRRPAPPLWTTSSHSFTARSMPAKYGLSMRPSRSVSPHPCQVNRTQVKPAAPIKSTCWPMASGSPEQYRPIQGWSTTPLCPGWESCQYVVPSPPTHLPVASSKP